MPFSDPLTMHQRPLRFLTNHEFSSGLFVAAGLHGFGLVLLAAVTWALLEEGSARQSFVVTIELASDEPQPLEDRGFELARSQAQMLVTPDEAQLNETTYRRVSPNVVGERLEAELAALIPGAVEPAALRPAPAEIASRVAVPTPSPPASGTPERFAPRRIETPSATHVSTAELTRSAAQVGTVETPADFSGNSPAIYPEEARRRGLEGTVFLRLHVSPRGTVERVEVLHGSGHPILDGAAVAMVRQWRGRPRTRDGEPIASLETIPVHFRLQ